MAISSVTSKVVYVGDGATLIFPYPFKIFAEADLTVSDYKTATGSASVLVLNSDYLVSGVGLDAGGNVTLSGSYTNLPTGSQLVIQRVMDVTQEVDYVENDPFPAQTHENALDKLTMIDQQLQEQLDRAMVQVITKTTPITFPLPVADLLLGWKNDLSGIENKIVGASTSQLPALGSSNAGLDVKVNLTSSGYVYINSKIINVRAYGAVGDGVADDSAAIQAAINSISAAATQAEKGGGAIIYFPAGIYLCNTGLINNGRKVSFIGNSVDDTTLKKGANDIDLLKVDSFIRYQTIKDITFDGNSKTGLSLLYLNTPNYVNLENLNIINSASAIAALYVNSATCSTFRNLYLTNNSKSAYFLGNAYHIYNFHIQGTSGLSDCILFDTGTDLGIFGMSVSDNLGITFQAMYNINIFNVYQETTLAVPAFTFGTSGKPCKGVHIQGINSTIGGSGSADSLIVVENNSIGISIRDVFITQTAAVAHTQGWIELGECYGVTIDNIMAQNMSTANVSAVNLIFSSGVGPDNVIISNVHSRDDENSGTLNLRMDKGTIINCSVPITINSSSSDINLIDCSGTLTDNNNKTVTIGKHRTGAVTLATGGTTTVVTYATSALTTSGRIAIFPQTSHAAVEVGDGTMYVSARTTANFTLTHANNTRTDRTFDYIAFSQLP